MIPEWLENHLYQDLRLSPPSERRQVLIKEMQALSEQKIHCLNCPGTCCTMSANSMQITPLEALDILMSLQISSANLEEVRQKLKENIQHYRLDHEISLGKKSHSHLRKTYTCPFFIPGPKGCSIKRELKPYGCLGFNPRLENDNGSQCQSNQTLLENREQNFSEQEMKANAYLKEKLNLYWNKLEIPKAVLALLDKFSSSSLK